MSRTPPLLGQPALDICDKLFPAYDDIMDERLPLDRALPNQMYKKPRTEMIHMSGRTTVTNFLVICAVVIDRKSVV